MRLSPEHQNTSKLQKFQKFFQKIGAEQTFDYFSGSGFMLRGIISGIPGVSISKHQFFLIYNFDLDHNYETQFK